MGLNAMDNRQTLVPANNDSGSAFTFTFCNESEL